MTVGLGQLITSVGLVGFKNVGLGWVSKKATHVRLWANQRKLTERKSTRRAWIAVTWYTR